MKRFSPTAFLLVLFVGVFAATPVSAATDGARNFVQSLSNEVIGVIESKSSDSAKSDKLKEIFLRSVDTDWMSRFVMGANYRALKDGQKQEYTNLYKDFLVYSYVPRFKEYTGEKLKIINIREDKNNEFFVQTELVRSSDKPAVRVDYRLRQKDGSYKLIDIIGEGVSLITTQRSDFAGVISRQGSDAFIKMLTERVKNLKAKS
ncbi:MAG: ABC transporter substrate-binding protein [Proteobacteria bacterium]|nr:ABC transporter substrate-binding protein [Pseudomonadota bacterium]